LHAFPLGPAVVEIEPVSRAHQLAIGGSFARRYRVARKLGQGVMGAVYLVDDAESGAQRALKVMNPELAADSKFLERFELEARVGARIASEHVVRVDASGVDRETGLPWLAMEYVAGRDLGAVLQGGALEPALAREVIAQLFDAMAAAHDVGVVHRDLKPENVLVGDAERAGGPPRVRVLDFGVAKVVRDATLSGTMPGLGTPLWTAPEQGQEGTVRPSADVWALGLLVFRVLTGRMFWRHAEDKSTAYDLAVELLRAPIPKASERTRELGSDVELPRGFDAWFARMVARDPAARFATAGEARDALAAIVPLRGAGPPVRPRWRLVAAGALALVVVAALASSALR
jgi:serine/threonine protein kinase